MKDWIKGRSGRWLRRSASTLGIFIPIAAFAWGCSDDDDGGAAPTGDGGGADAVSPGSDGGTSPDGSSTPGDNGTITSVTAAATGGATFRAPADSTPDPKGENVYFTALSGDDGTAGVFKVPAAGGTVSKVFSGAPLVHAVNLTISVDGAQLYIADPAATTTDDHGGVFVLPTGGGTPTALGGTDGYRPKGVTIAGSSLYFAGVDKANGKPGVFKIPTSGGNVEVVAEGGAIFDPSGIAVSSGGDVFFVDSIGVAGLSVLYKVVGGTPQALGASFGAGYPSGIALSGDAKFVLLSAISRTTFFDEVIRVDVGTGTSTSNNSGPVGTNIEAAGLHRAHAANVYTWADSLAGGKGTVYVLKP